MASSIGITPVTQPFQAIKQSYANARAGVTSNLEEAALDPRIRSGAAVFKFERQLGTANSRLPEEIGEEHSAKVKRFQQTSRHVIIERKMLSNTIIQTGLISRGMMRDVFA